MLPQNRYYPHNTQMYISPTAHVLTRNLYSGITISRPFLLTNVTKDKLFTSEPSVFQSNNKDLSRIFLFYTSTQLLRQSWPNITANSVRHFLLYNSYAPINVKPQRGGGGGAYMGDLINLCLPTLGNLILIFIPRVGIFEFSDQE